MSESSPDFLFDTEVASYIKRLIASAKWLENMSQPDQTTDSKELLRKKSVNKEILLVALDDIKTSESIIRQYITKNSSDNEKLTLIDDDNNKESDEINNDNKQKNDNKIKKCISSSKLHVNTKEKENLWDPTPGLFYPTMFPKIFHKGEYLPFEPNSRKSIPFETEFFIGSVLLVMNTLTSLHLRDEDPYKDRFQDKKYQFEIQVQGRFKYIPEGEVFIGAEITKKMELGVMTRSIAGGILKFARTLNAYLHHSFGDDENFELPHVTGPLWSAIDRLIITQDGDPLPILGVNLEENLQDRKIRRAPNFVMDIKTTCTYSFSFKTSNLDINNWQACNLPLLGVMSLSTFWGDADLRLCAYIIPKGSPGVGKQSNGLPKYHPQASLLYMFNLEVKHISNHPELEGTQIDSKLNKIPSNSISDGNLNYNKSLPNILSPNQSVLSLLNRDEIENYGGEESDGDNSSSSGDSSDDDNFFDARDDSNPIIMNNEINNFEIINKSDKNKNNGENRKNSSDFDMNSVYNEVNIKDNKYASTSSKQRTYASSSSSNCNNYVLAAFDVDDKRKSRQVLRRTLYAFVLDPSQGERENTPTSRRCVFHTYKEWTASFPEVGFGKDFSIGKDRLSDIEQRRHELNRSYQRIYNNEKKEIISSHTTKKYKEFLVGGTHTKSFLVREPSGGVCSKRLKHGLPPFLLEDLVFVQEGNFYWSEQCIGIIEGELIFIKSSGRLSPVNRTRIPLRNIVGAHLVEPSLQPFTIPDVHFILICTFSRQIQIMIKGEISSNKWLKSLNSSQRSMSVLVSSSKYLDLLVRPKGWHLGDRVILNARSFTRCSLTLTATDKDSTTALLDSPVELIELLLKMAFVLCEAVNNESIDNDVDEVHNYQNNSPSKYGDMITRDPETLWLKFMDGVALLQAVDISKIDLSSNEALCMFLNLFHVMLLHSYLVVGLPNSLSKWPALFNTCSYEAFGDIFSLAELEHNIIRAGMHKPTLGLIAQAFTPVSRYSFALNRADFRLIWALNYGSLQMINMMPIYVPDRLEEQLNSVVRESLSIQMSVSNNVITLPQICQWRHKDFDKIDHDQHSSMSSSLTSSLTYSSMKGMYQAILPHCRGDNEAKLFRLLSKNKTLHVKYTPFDFRCRFFREVKLEDEEYFYE